MRPPAEQQARSGECVPEEGRSKARRRLGLRHAVLLGLIQGPAELLPVSSSAHTVLVPELLGWPSELDPEEAKTFEIALHYGAALGLILTLRRELREGLRRPGVLALSLAPPTLVGFAFERPIERRLSGPRMIAVNLLAGGVAMAVADLRGAQTRWAQDTTAADGLALGVAQALALVPGVSRNGATLTAARARGLRRAEAQTLSWQVALPPILGATLLKGRRMLTAGVAPGLGRPLAAGAAAAFASTVACSPLLSPARRARSLLPFSLYRAGLAALVIARRRQDRSTRPTQRSEAELLTKKIGHTRF
ncbi:MAG TPA: undecaprenyl-diphosphate phosphatase [Solirubrobacteraceae bacterium]|jgi:undecaprenyl-diphosphatase|nr:undecaprenyl-diphosphate phosphatase [Solirubrobacteraceae bacterium]